MRIDRKVGVGGLDEVGARDPSDLTGEAKLRSLGPLRPAPVTITCPKSRVLNDRITEHDIELLVSEGKRLSRSDLANAETLATCGLSRDVGLRNRHLEWNTIDQAARERPIAAAEVEERRPRDWSDRLHEQIGARLVEALPKWAVNRCG